MLVAIPPDLLMSAFQLCVYQQPREVTWAKSASCLVADFSFSTCSRMFWMAWWTRGCKMV